MRTFGSRDVFDDRNLIRDQPIESVHEGFDLLQHRTGTASKLHGLLGIVILCLTQVTKELTEEPKLLNLVRR